MSLFTGQGVILERKEFEEKFGTVRTKEKLEKLAFDLYEKNLSFSSEKKEVKEKGEIYVAKIKVWKDAPSIFFLGELYDGWRRFILHGESCRSYKFSNT